MAFSPLFSLLSLISLLLAPPFLAQTPSTPAPTPGGPINITAILEKGGQYATLIHLINYSQMGDQINNQLNNSHDGMTIFAPTDNAFTNLPAGTLNTLNTMQQQVQLILYHVAPKYYSRVDLLTVSNPIRTQASSHEGIFWGLYFSGEGNQINVSTEVVETQINNALRQETPLAVYQVDKVLIPKEFTEAKLPWVSPPPPNTTSTGFNTMKSTGAAVEE
ncbi:fasciclin-like arabinogalactan protein 9 [Actinidia eriantha]|uniref:fasciclin-like arabinogalactan protein 9 n=1 Tax=Actinidia eriantha TaxID=165200 RepID=UPI002586DF46|nr:fasciclin-like arabinogalactan protein 9 [Actinidia eriantha]